MTPTEFCNGCSCPTRPAQWASPLVYCQQIRCDCHCIWWQAVEREKIRTTVEGRPSLIERLWEAFK